MDRGKLILEPIPRVTPAAWHTKHPVVITSRPRNSPNSPSTTTMAEVASPPAGSPLRRVLTGEESAQLRRRPPTNRFSTTVDDGGAPAPGGRRRSSNFSDYSLREARKSFQSSTDDLLLPKAGRGDGMDSEGRKEGEGSSAWHSAPLAFALLPALGGMLFTNGSSVTTDILLLGLAAIFLNWSVRIPW